MVKQFVDHFEGFLGATDHVIPINNSEELFRNRLSMEEAMAMIQDVSCEEVKDALFGIGDSKAAGPDGFFAFFFKRAWSVVGKDICQAIQEFFHNGKLLSEVNSTLIHLVPKCINPNNVTDYRPIACCNVLYKCIGKILTNRLKPVLSRLINKSQSAFVPGRLIHDNILLSQELLKGYNTKKGIKRCALKVNLAKAYDTINWKFLENALVGYGFHSQMINWIMRCVTTASFSICINGERHGFFRSGRRLRQGDPISPYLFTLVMEVFSLMMERNINRNKEFKYHRGCKEVKLSHLSFADDLLILCHGDHKSVSVIKDTLEEFSSASGLKPNYGKSTVFFGSINVGDQKRILEILPFKVGALPVKYLGIPLIAKKIGINDCKMLVERIKSKVNNWTNKTLSYTGKLQLIASVLAAMQTYWASAVLLLKAVIKEIERVMKGFLWNQGKSAKGRAKIAWAEVCRPKDEGGLGLKDLGMWNEALLPKHIWKLLYDKDNIWANWINVVKLKGSSFWEVEPDVNDSGTWRALLDLREKVRPFVVSIIGNGETTSIWYDNWHKVGPLSKIVPLKSILDARLKENATIADMIENEVWSWPSDWNTKFLGLSQVEVPSIKNGGTDHIKWKTKKGDLVDCSTREIWNSLKEEKTKVKWWRFVWFSQCNIRHAFILWVAIHGKLMTQDRMAKWCNEVLLCPLCNKVNDSHDHLFFQCEYSADIWTVMKGKLSLGPLNTSNGWKQIIQYMETRGCSNSIGSIPDRIIVTAMVFGRKGMVGCSGKQSKVLRG